MKNFNELFEEDFNEGLNEIMRKHDLKIKEIKKDTEEIMKRMSVF
jgi:hypothetical protein